jgi:hypothetical protein
VHDDTKIGGSEGRFPATRHFVVRELGCAEASRRRLQHGIDNETAKDWTQGFFAFSLEKGSLQRFDESRARWSALAFPSSWRASSRR